MEAKEIRANLNKPVTFFKPGVASEPRVYILTAGIFRKNDKGEFFYQLELREPKLNSVVIAGLEQVQTIGGNDDLPLV